MLQKTSLIQRTEPIGDVEVEKHLLGSLIVNNKKLYDINEIITDDEFLLPVHQRIYNRVCWLISNDLIATPLTLRHELKDENAFAAAGISCYDYLCGIVTSVQFTHDIKTLAKIVHSYYIKRCLVEIGSDMLKSSYAEGHVGAENIIEQACKKLLDISSSGNRRDYHIVTDVMQQVISKVSMMYKDGKHITGVPTGFVDMDVKTGGMQKSDLVIIAARPSMGKTSLAINMCINAAEAFQSEYNSIMVKDNDMDENARRQIKQQYAAFFSLEMSAEQLVNRILAIGTGIDSSRLRTGNINKAELEKLLHGSEKRFIENLPIIIDDTPAITISGIRSRVIRLMRQYNIGLVVVDYLQLVRVSSNKSNANRVQEIGEISQGLKALAREMHIPVIALSQLSRAVESRDDKRPQLSDLRDSGNIEQDADVVMFLYREEYYLERKKIPTNETKHNEWQDKLNRVKNIAEVIIAKQRNGPIGSLMLHFHSATTAFNNLDSHHYIDDME